MITGVWKYRGKSIRLVQLWQAVRRWRRQMQTRRVLQQMSDERLRDIGLRREDVE
ncbi:DUF1127 domain-containing protein [Escherichia coli]|uniref:DUF1127 domain-containing protein n=1 Tax=Escherichia coli TaxID=562 RepID=UPI003917E964